MNQQLASYPLPLCKKYLELLLGKDSSILGHARENHGVVVSMECLGNDTMQEDILGMLDVWDIMGVNGKSGIAGFFNQNLEVTGRWWTP